MSRKSKEFVMTTPSNDRVHDPRPARRRRGDRRGNAIVLVAGLLVLLVIIVTAFLTSTRSTRDLAQSNRQFVVRERGVEGVADFLAADVIADALFARPVDKSGTGGMTPDVFSAAMRDGNRFRLPVPFETTRWNVDFDEDGDGAPDVAWNFAPYQVVPWTNWPDNLEILGYPAGDEERWPAQPGSLMQDPDPGTPGLAQALTEGNPLGDPGFGDTRWLSDTEPLRFDLVRSQYEGGGTVSNSGIDGMPNAFSMWRHLSYIGRADNGWRVVSDISNVSENLVTNLRYPVEQFLVDRLPTSSTASNYWNTFWDPDSGFAFWDVNSSYGRWQDWFYNYPQVYANPNTIPQNFIRLDDPNADAVFDPPSDAFVRGTPRWDVERVLADADGDGFTDSYWWLDPNNGPDGTRRVIAVRIVDNSGRLNMNVATRAETGRGFSDISITGETPSDLAAFSDPDVDPVELGGSDPNRNFPFLRGHETGMLDSPLRQDSVAALIRLGSNLPSQLFDGDNAGPDVAWGGYTVANNTRGPWEDWVDSLRVRPVLDFGLSDPQRDMFVLRGQRRLYYVYAGSRPEDPLAGITPFGIDDEIELRMFHGQNFPWAMSSFERALTRDVNDVLDDSPQDQIIRGARSYQESSAFMPNAAAPTIGDRFKLNNFELFTDVRHRLTMFNGVRNDLKPPWLRWRGTTPEYLTVGLGQELLNSGVAPGTVRFNQRFTEETRKFIAQAARRMDLRENNPNRFLYNAPNPGPFDFDPSSGSYFFPTTDFQPGSLWERYLHERLADELLIAIVETDTTGPIRVALGDTPASYDSIDGTGTIQTGDPDQLEDEREIAASLAANILSRRDDDRIRMNPVGANDLSIPEIDRLRARRQNVAPLYPEVYTSGQAGAVPLPAFHDNYFIPNDQIAALSPAELYLPAVRENRDVRALGVEPQPFLTEAMLCFVYGGTEVPVFPEEAGSTAERPYEYYPYGTLRPPDTGGFGGTPGPDGDGVIANPNPALPQQRAPMAIGNGEGIVDGGGQKFLAGFPIPITGVTDGANPEPEAGEETVYYIDDESDATTVAVIQLANPFKHVIPWNELRKYEVNLAGTRVPMERIFAQAIALNPEYQWDFYPSIDDNPVTLTIVVADSSFTYKSETSWTSAAGTANDTLTDFRDKWLDFLDLEATTFGVNSSVAGRPDTRSLVITLNWGAIGLSDQPDNFIDFDTGAGGGIGGGPGGDPPSALIELVRVTYQDQADRTGENAAPVVDWTAIDTGSTQLNAFEDRVVVDRFGQTSAGGGRESEFLSEVTSFRLPNEGRTRQNFLVDPDISTAPEWEPYQYSTLNGIRFKGGSIFMRPVTVKRAWSRIRLNDNERRIPTAEDADPLFPFGPSTSGPRFVIAEEQVFGPSTYRRSRPVTPSVNTSRIAYIQAPTRCEDANDSVPQGLELGALQDFAMLIPPQLGVAEGTAAGIPQLTSRFYYRGNLEPRQPVDVACPNGGGSEPNFIPADGRRYFGWVVDFGLDPDPNTQVAESRISAPGNASEDGETWFWEYIAHPFLESGELEEFGTPRGGGGGFGGGGTLRMNPPQRITGDLTGSLAGGSPPGNYTDGIYGIGFSSDVTDNDTPPGGRTSNLIGRRPTYFDGGKTFLALALEDSRLYRTLPEVIRDRYRFNVSGIASTGANAIDGNYDYVANNVVSRGRGIWKGEFGLDASFQMSQKEGDYQQVGEVLLAFTASHLVEFDASNRYIGTRATFSEQMRGGQRDIFAGRLAARGRIIGDASAQSRFEPSDRRHSVPAMEAAYRVLSLFVCDGPGFNWDPNLGGPSNPNYPIYDEVVFNNAASFSGRATPGLINVNTASQEVLATLPHWGSIRHEDRQRFTLGGAERPDYGAMALPHAVVGYRERFDNESRSSASLLSSNGIPNGPNQTIRPNFPSPTGSFGRGERGFADIGELLQIRTSGRDIFPKIGETEMRGTDIQNLANTAEIAPIRMFPDSWRMDAAGLQPFNSSLFEVDDPLVGNAIPWRYRGTRIGTDVDFRPGTVQSNPPDPNFDAYLPPLFDGTNGVGDPTIDNRIRQADIDILAQTLANEGDLTAGDAEERRLLFNGASNLVTTSSDMFTVYFRVRTFSPKADGTLDATDRSAVQSDRRYVMLVDRSKVMTPADEPRIVYIQEVPD